MIAVIETHADNFADVRDARANARVTSNTRQRLWIQCPQFFDTLRLQDGSRYIGNMRGQVPQNAIGIEQSWPFVTEIAISK